MIYCVLDGDRVYPSLSSNIKITRENPELKDKGSYTLEVTFPMSIYENQMKFRHLNRLDVSLSKNGYDSATLYVDRNAVISGIGVVTSVSNKEVKLQIMNANSQFKYASGFDKKYIDDVPYFKLWGRFSLIGNPPTYPRKSPLSSGPVNYTEATRSQNYVGDASVGVYVPIYDETNDILINEIFDDSTHKTLSMTNLRCQPNLLYVMRMLLLEEGYIADLSVIDAYPWNRVYIINTGYALPHWTLERFINEFKAFFGLSLRFDGKRAIFGRINYDEEAVCYECLDEFTSEYDDEGIQSNSTSNLKYNLFDSAEKTFYTEIPDEIMNAFTIREYASEREMDNAFASLAYEEKVRSIFSTPTGYFYARLDSATSQFSLTRAGQFNKLVRDQQSDDEVSLGIAPVTMAKINTKFARMRIEQGLFFVDTFVTEQEADISVILPTAGSEGTAEARRMSITPSVQQALEQGESVGTATRSESDRMEVFFLGTGTKSFSALDKTVTVAAVGTDPTIDSDFKDKVSFALSKVPDGTVHVGQFHTGISRINGKNQRCIKFLCDDIPDPTRIYMFHNKRYVCEKIEIQVTGKGIDQVKTGYFYEIVS